MGPTDNRAFGGRASVKPRVVMILITNTVIYLPLE
jgi:hypothetical protein